MNPAKPAEHRWVVVVLLVTAMVRLLIAALTPLFPDETYYWEWSRRLAFGYFDHPPLVAWLVRAGTVIFGDTPLGVRFGPVMAGIAGTWFIAAAARRLAGDRAGLVTAIIFAVMPLSAAGLVLATPDAGLLACVAATLYCVVRALDSSPAGSSRGLSLSLSLKWWSFAGVAQGLAFWAKYTSVLVPVGLLIAIVARSEWRSRLREPSPYVAVVVASLVFAPVLVWNSQHEWISFTYQLEHGLTGSGGSILRREGELIGGQLGLVSPILFVMIAIAVGRSMVSKSPATVSSLLSLVSVFCFAFFAYSTTKRRPEANWPAIAYLPGVLVLVAHARTLRWDRWLKAGIVVSAMLTLITYVNAFVPILPVPARRDPAGRASGWQDLARAVDSSTAFHAPRSASRLFVAGNRYQEASELAFHLPNQPATLALNIEGRPNQYDLWPSFAQRASRGDSLLLVVDDVEPAHPAVSALLPHFDAVQRDAQVILARRGDAVKHLRIWTLSGWRGTWPEAAIRSRP